MSAEPITGLSAQEHSVAVNQGMALAHSVRKRWLTSLIAGEVSFKAVVEYSRSEDETRYLSALRLYDILRARPGWSDVTALDVIQRNGFTDRDNIKSIRRSPRKVDLFTQILLSTADRWRGRPAPPEGWPWNGKLQLLIAAANAPLPPELTLLLDGGETDQPVEAPLPNLISSLLDDEEDEGE